MKTPKKPPENKEKTKSPDVCVTGLGLVTSVGHDHVTACASMRAEFRQPERLTNYYVETKDGFDDPDDGYVTGHPVLDGDPDDAGTRMFTLLNLALADLSKGVEDSSFFEETPFYLALPDDQRFRITDDEVYNLFSEHTSFPCSKDLCRIYRNGHAGMVYALHDAADALKKGRAPRVVIAGTDSLINFSDLDRFSSQYRLKTVLNPDGLMPGEAASALLVETVTSAKKRNVTPRCLVHAVAVSRDSKPFVSGHPPAGEGFTQAIRGVMPADSETPFAVDALIADLNGESYRFTEWALVESRILQSIKGEKNLILPSRFLGDTGCASPGIAVAMAVRGMERGYLFEGTSADGLTERSGKALILSGSDSGERGAVVVGEWEEKTDTST